MKNKEIGGYFSFEISNKGHDYHRNSIKLNSCRNALEYILRDKKPSKVYIPYYNCDVVLEPFIKTNTKYEYYAIEKNLELLLDIKLKDNEYLLYVNYFGIKNKYVDYLIYKYEKNLIIDSSQSFFSKYGENIYAIYSPRKFFGVSDGGYLYGDLNSLSIKRDSSIDRMQHLFGRLESEASKYYKLYKRNDDSLKNQPIMKMSKITELILNSIDYESIKIKRNTNFKYIHEHLKEFNKIKIDLMTIDGPMVYPLLLDKDLKDVLIANKIYIATYWNNVLKIKNIPHTEVFLTKNIIPLPIDQRYTIDDMEIIIQIVK